MNPENENVAAKRSGPHLAEKHGPSEHVSIDGKPNIEVTYFHAFANKSIYTLIL